MHLDHITPRAGDPPSCPRCGSTMTGGAPHGPWPVQWECHRCGTVVVPRSWDHAAPSCTTPRAPTSSAATGAGERGKGANVWGDPPTPAGRNRQ